MRFLLVLLLILTNCGRADYSWPAYVRFAPLTSPEHVFMASQPLKELNKFMETDVVVFSLDAKNALAFPVTIKFSDQASENGWAGVAAVYDSLCQITIYPVAIKNNILKTVLWHEVAHCAGLLHVKEDGHIMSPQIGSFSSYNEEKLQFFKNQLKPVLDRKAR